MTIEDKVKKFKEECDDHTKVYEENMRRLNEEFKEKCTDRIEKFICDVAVIILGLSTISSTIFIMYYLGRV